MGDTTSDGVDETGESHGYLLSPTRFADFYSVMEGLSYEFPTISEGGVLTTNENSRFGISASSENKEMAFEFIAMLLSEDTQRYVYDGFPVLKTVYEEQYADALNAGAYMPEVIYNGISKSAACIQTDQDVFDIIEDEAAVFFAGDETAAEAAEVIQSRVQIYLDEQN